MLKIGTTSCYLYSLFYCKILYKQMFRVTEESREEYKDSHAWK